MRRFGRLVRAAWQQRHPPRPAIVVYWTILFTIIGMTLLIVNWLMPTFLN